MPPKKPDPKKGKPKKDGKSSSAGAKAKKKKWSKGKVQEKLYAEAPKWKVITVAILSDRLKINGSLARDALNLLESEKVIRRVAPDCKIYTRVVKAN